MDSRLVKFLKDREVCKGEPFTHTSKISPCRSYYIEGDDLEAFYEIYNQVIHDGGMAGMTENPEPVVPLIVDIDFRCTLDNGTKRYYKPKHIKEIISTLISRLNSILPQIRKPCYDSFVYRRLQ